MFQNRSLRYVKNSIQVKYLPDEKNTLLGEYCRVFTRLKEKNDKEKLQYQDNAEYYRARSKQWKLDNPEKQKQHMENYFIKKGKKEGLIQK